MSLALHPGLFRPTYSRAAMQRMATALYFAVAVPIVVEIDHKGTYTIPATKWTHGQAVRTIYSPIAAAAARRVVRELEKQGWLAYPLLREETTK